MTGKTIALIGVGVMGRGIAHNLVKTGCNVHLYTRNNLNIKDIESPTTKIFSNVVEAVTDADFVILCLTFDHVVEDIVFNTGLIDNCKGTLIDFGTTSPELTQKIYRHAKEKGFDFFDSPMTGSKIAAENGEILFMIGGNEDLYQKAKMIYEACGKNVIKCGEVGNGQKAKIALNVIIAGMVQIYAEGLVLAKKMGVDKNIMGKIISESGAKSGISEFKLPYMFAKNFEIHFALKNMNKDLNHAIKQAMKYHASLPLTSALKGIFDSGMTHGLKDEDFCSIIKLAEKENNIEI